MARKAAGSIPRDPTVIHDGEIVGKDAFKLVFDDFLRRMEPVKAHTKVRDLAVRIELGEAKTAKALAAVGYPGGVPNGPLRPNGALGEALALLDALRVERQALYREWIVPHYVMHAVWLILDQAESKLWPITDQGSVSVKLPGILTFTVQVQTEPPF